MTWMWLLPLSAVLVCITIGFYSHALTQRQWGRALTSGQDEVAHLRAMAASELSLARATYSDAGAATSPVEVARLLDLAFEYVSGLTDGRLARLAHMAQLARTAAAIAPVTPLLPRDYNLGQIRTVAALSLVAHHILVSSGERFRLHVSTLSLGFKLARRTLRKAPAGPWEAGLDDWATLDEAHIEAFRLVVLTLEAEAARAREAV